jgi:transposase
VFAGRNAIQTCRYLTMKKAVVRMSCGERHSHARRLLQKGYPPTLIANALNISRSSLYYKKQPRSRLQKENNPNYKEALLAILHSPPAEHDINRTTWTTKLLSRVLTSKGYAAGHNTVSKIIKKAGYKFRKARVVLTSNDPQYREKLGKITDILASLGPKDRFFSIDEFGPFAVKKRGGQRLVPANEYPTVPQWQRSKGFLIVTAALELSQNQVTHFFSKTKDSAEMIKLLDMLLDKYAGCRRIYLSWDAASWHASKLFMARVKHVNERGYRKGHNAPSVRLAPLPARAQFLNVIESIFSGMAKAIVHNSDYESVNKAMEAIDRYFVERNEHFAKHPKRAGNKIWGREIVAPEFREGQNCKEPKWR